MYCMLRENFYKSLFINHDEVEIIQIIIGINQC